MFIHDNGLAKIVAWLTFGFIFFMIVILLWETCNG